MDYILSEFPFLETLVSALLAFALGIVWYHPKVTGARWVAAREKVPSGVKMRPSSIAVSIALWVLSASFYSFILILMDASSLNAMLSISCLLWVAFAMPPILMGSLYTGYPFQTVAIDSAYHLGGYYLFALVHAAGSLFLI